MATTIEEQLGWERRRRPVAGIAAIVGGFAWLIGSVYQVAAVDHDKPAGTAVDALSRAAAGQAQNVNVLKIEYLSHKTGQMIISGIPWVIGGIAIALAMTFLGRAVQFRVPPLAEGQRVSVLQVMRQLVGVGPIVTGAGYCGWQVAHAIDAHNFKPGNYPDPAKRDAAAHLATNSHTAAAIEVVMYVGILLMVAGFIIVCLHARRVGLLTNFMGVLGILVGAVFILQWGAVPIIPGLWLIGLGVLFLGRLPTGTPPAWAAGEAVPWPSRQDIVDQRRADADAKAPAAKPSSASSNPFKAKTKKLAGTRVERAEGDTSAPEARAPVRTGKPNPSASKKKRKRR